MDKIVDYAGQIGLQIILDHHRSDAAPAPRPTACGTTPTHSQARMGRRLADAGAALRRQPDGDRRRPAQRALQRHLGRRRAQRLAAAAERAGNAIGAVNPNWLIFVEGIGTYQGQSYWWGGNLMGVKDHPVVLNVPNKLVYSPHDYPDSVYPQPWFSDPSYPANLPAKFDPDVGLHLPAGHRAGLARRVRHQAGRSQGRALAPGDHRRISAATSTMTARRTSRPASTASAGPSGRGIPNSGDTGGILADDWKTVNQTKLAYLTPIEFSLGSAPGAPPATPPTSRSPCPRRPRSRDGGLSTRSPATADGSDFTASQRLAHLRDRASRARRSRSPIIRGHGAGSRTSSSPSCCRRPVGATISAAPATGTIIDDIATAALPTLSVGDATFHEGTTAAPGQGTFTVSLSAPSTSPVTVHYATADGTAIAGKNYLAQSGTLTIAAGETQKAVTITAIDDQVVTANHSFSLLLSAPTGATVLRGIAAGTIINDDVAPPSPPSGLDTHLSVVDSWNVGFNADVTVHNSGAAATKGWQIEIDMPYQISQIWNATIVSHAVGTYIIGNAAWNGQIPQGGQTNFGFIGSGPANPSSIQVDAVNTALLGQQMASAFPASSTGNAATPVADATAAGSNQAQVLSRGT